MPNMKQGHGRSKADMAKPDVTTVTTHWTELAKTISVPHTEAEYRRLVAFLDRLIDEVGTDEKRESRCPRICERNCEPL